MNTKACCSRCLCTAVPLHDLLWWNTKLGLGSTEHVGRGFGVRAPPGLSRKLMKSGQRPRTLHSLHERNIVEVDDDALVERYAKVLFDGV